MVVRHTIRPIQQLIRGGLERDLPQDPKPREVYFSTDTRILWVCDDPGKWKGVRLGYR